MLKKKNLTRVTRQIYVKKIIYNLNRLENIKAFNAHGYRRRALMLSVEDILFMCEYVVGT